MVNISKYGGAGMMIMAKPSMIMVTAIATKTICFILSCSRYFFDSRLSTWCWVSKNSRFVTISSRLCSWSNPLKASNFCWFELLSIALFIFCCMALTSSLSTFPFFSNCISSSAFMVSSDSSLFGWLLFKGI